MTPKLLIAIYGHPEAYPPTLNALEQLAKLFSNIDLLYRPALKSSWSYPPGVRLIPSGPERSATELQRLPAHKRYGLLAAFAARLLLLVRRERPDVVLLYDPLALLAYRWVRGSFGYQPIVWYHNHDVIEVEQLRPLSLGWLAKQAEAPAFEELEIFSLPANERQACFPMASFKGRYFFLPNLPSRAFYGQERKTQRDDRPLRLLFQGRIGAGHGIETILAQLPFRAGGRPVHLTLAGSMSDDYQRQIERSIEERGLHDVVEILGNRPYAELPEITASCHVGLAIYQGTSVMNRTVGTASNKIYEYASVGLPVVYFDNAHFREHLGRFRWAVPCDASGPSLIAALERIVANYPELSVAARSDFERQLNYELHFQPVREHLLALLERRGRHDLRQPA